MTKFSLLLLAAVLACVGSVLAFSNGEAFTCLVPRTGNILDDEELTTTPQLKEAELWPNETTGLPSFNGGFNDGSIPAAAGCNAPSKVTFYIASNSASDFGGFTKVLKKALKPIYALYNGGSNNAFCKFAKTTYFKPLPDKAKVQLQLDCAYPCSSTSCTLCSTIHEAVTTGVVKKNAVTYIAQIIEKPGPPS